MCQCRWWNTVTVCGADRENMSYSECVMCTFRAQDHLVVHLHLYVREHPGATENVHIMLVLKFFMVMQQKQIK